MAHRFVAGWYLRNAKEDFESVRASRRAIWRKDLKSAGAMWKSSRVFTTNLKSLTRAV